MRSQQGGLCVFHMIQTHHTCIILTDSAPGWCFLPGELEAFHQYGEEGPRSEACRGHRAARSHRCCMLTDSLTDPHLPCTVAKGCTQAGGGVGGRMVQTRTDGQGPKSRRSCCSAEHLCQKSTPPWGSPVFVFVFFGGVSSSPKRRGGERRRSSHGANRVLQQEEQQL